MITLYLSPSCTSCRKAKAWLEEHNLEFEVRNIFQEPLTVDEVKSLMRLTEEGTKELVSTRSKTYQNLDVDLDDMPMGELYKLIAENPSLLKRPIMIDEKHLQVGFNEEEIRSFLPRKVRNFELQNILRSAN
ncbi:ArsR family transcriptional regulator [Pontibacillus halophilus JSM 076056 = DSM 19796]|uniref:Global transcriptional regulator Spx n=1 Tax=Pontibacillus halophilus JSM 076056 = DSM 19796 TaxID=1385510 RepID=A0A0A5I996_9BACI|nr:transcriptional regulator SpxA [Pontibacillus halophilus]KGX92412.1 ArsR family transcriptional regulator [Pontibacillus halophilus JSM 076056 = DSM 19796]